MVIYLEFVSPLVRGCLDISMYSDVAASLIVNIARSPSLWSLWKR
jgi:hypothetical protein